VGLDRIRSDETANVSYWVRTGQTGGGERGFDGAKLIKGRKRILLVDTLGLVHGLLVHSAGMQDRTGGRLVLEQCRGLMPRLRRVWTDGAYRGRLVRWVRRTRRWVLQIISRPAGSNGFLLLKWRWIVERSFGWLNLSRRLSKDYELLPASSEAFIRIAMLSIMLRRLARYGDHFTHRLLRSSRRCVVLRVGEGRVADASDRDPRLVELDEYGDLSIYRRRERGVLLRRVPITSTAATTVRT
jgi:transposase